MDFQTLTRRELQALCKRNKIPANTTNVAMAQALKSLDLVEGIGEIMPQSQSGTAQSSTYSLEMEEVSSPCVPPTAGKSTRRTKIPKPAADSVNPTTRTRRTARKAQVNDDDAIETPAPMTHTNRKKDQTASACLNMNSQLNECADEDNKEFMVTPAPLGPTSRRRRVEESAATRVYSTRRSARLAQKSKVETSTESGNEESQGFKKDMAVNDGVDSFKELSEITDESEVVSTGKEESEVVSEQKNTATVGEDNKMGSYAEVEECTNCETEAKLEEEKSVDDEDKTLNVSNEVQGNDVSQDVPISEIEITVEKSTEELKPEEGESSQDEAAKFVYEVILESGDNFVADGNTGFHDDTIMEGGSKDVTELNVALTELTLQQDTKEANSEFIDRLDILVHHNKNEANKVESLQLVELELTETEILHLGESEKSTKPVPSDEQYFDFSEQIPNSEELEKSAADDEPYTVFSEKIPKSGLEPTETEILHLEESEKSTKPVPSDEQYFDFSEQIPNSGVDVQVILDSRIPAAADPEHLDESDADFSEQTLGSDLGGLENEPTETEVLHLKDSEKFAKTVMVTSDEQYADLSEQTLESDLGGLENEPTETEDETDADFFEQTLGSDLEELENEPSETEVLTIKDSEKSAKMVTSDEQYADLSEQILKSGVDVEGSLYSRDIVQPVCLTPCKNSDSMTVKMTDFSENIESGTELVVMGEDDDVKMFEKGVDDDLHDMRSGLEGLKNVPNETKVLHLEESEKVAKPVASDEQYDDLFKQILKSGVDVVRSIESLDIVQSACLTSSKNSDSTTMMTDISENTESGTELVVMGEDDDVKMFEKGVDDDLHDMRSGLEGLKNVPNETKVLHLEESEKVAKPVASDEQYDDLFKQILKSGVDVVRSIESLDIVQSACLTSSKNSDSTTMMTDISENTESGTELVVMRDDDVKMSQKSVDDDFHDMSMRKLTKMLKDKLEITKKPSKDENGNEATTRTALQVISKNQLVEESQN